MINRFLNSNHLLQVVTQIENLKWAEKPHVAVHDYKHNMRTLEQAWIIVLIKVNHLNKSWLGEDHLIIPGYSMHSHILFSQYLLKTKVLYFNNRCNIHNSPTTTIFPSNFFFFFPWWAFYTKVDLDITSIQIKFNVHIYTTD